MTMRCEKHLPNGQGRWMTAAKAQLTSQQPNNFTIDVHCDLWQMSLHKMKVQLLSMLLKKQNLYVRNKQNVKRTFI